MDAFIILVTAQAAVKYSLIEFEKLYKLLVVDLFALSTSWVGSRGNFS